MFVLLYLITLISLVIYSYALIDPNLTLINNPLWVSFRDQMVYFGYYLRGESWYTFVGIVTALFIVHYFFIKKYKKLNPLLLGGITAGILLFSYPFTSHDLFNYIFDAKIFTFYHQNPYTHSAANYPTDEWIRFMQWTERSYPYGPIYLVISFIPSFLGFGKFILHFLLFKLLSAVFYLLGIYYLQKMDKKLAVIFATHPLILIEGLIASHNDFISISLAIIGLYYLEKEKNIMSRLFLLCSAGIKYITAPVVLLQKKNLKLNSILFIIQLGLLLYLAITKDIHAWYFLTLFAYMPLFRDLIQKLWIFFYGLLLGYYPFIRLGDWDADRVVIKKTIMITALVINLLYIGYLHRETILAKITSKNS